MPGGGTLARCGALLLGAVGLGLAGGCFSPYYRSVDEQQLRLTGDYVILPDLVVPEVRGPDGCGAQALASVMAYHDPAADPAALAADLPWHEQGATPVDLLLAARERGFQATVASGTWEAVAECVRQGRPPLVMIDAAPEVRTLLRFSTPRRMHWSVVAGMATDGSRVLLGARGGRCHVAERDDFLKRWSRSDNCLLVVTRPQPPS